MNTGKDRIIMELIMYICVVAVILFLAAIIGGCSNTIKEFKEPSFNQGCYASTVDASLGYLNQAGNGEACKVKCSEILPDGYCWQYNNQRTGCSAKVGICD